MSTCGQIAASILVDCDYPMIGGANDTITLINHDDWLNATITRDGSNDQLITAITLPSGKLAYKYEGQNNSVEPAQRLVKLRYSNLYEHEVMFKVFKADAATKEELETLAKGKVVAIIENNFKGSGGASAFEIYGEDSGLELQELERVIAEAETQGAFSLVIKSSESSRESHLPATFYDTDYATTKAAVTALLT